MSGSIAASLLAGFSRALAGATIQTREFVPDPTQRIYYGNHASHLDFIVIWSALPAEVRTLTRPVAAKDYWGRGTIRRWLARDVFRAILIERDADRRTTNPIDDILQAMGDNDSIIIFPEGTRGTGLEIAPFKSGIYHLGRRKPTLELVPVYLENLNRILPKGEIVPIPLLSSLHIGRPIRVEEGESKDDFLQRARDALMRLAS